MILKIASDLIRQIMDSIEAVIISWDFKQNNATLTKNTWIEKSFGKNDSEFR